MSRAATLAHCEHQCLNAARLGCPLAQFIADNARARALNAARTEQAEADYAADPKAFERRRHDDALAGEQFYHPSY